MSDDGIRGEVKWDVIGKRAAGRYRNFSACAFVNQVHISDIPAIWVELRSVSGVHSVVENPRYVFPVSDPKYMGRICIQS